MPYHRSYKNNDKWYVFVAIAFFGILTGLALYFNEEYSEENIKKQQEQNRKYIWQTEQTYVPETKPDNKDTIDNKLK